MVAESFQLPRSGAADSGRPRFTFWTTNGMNPATGYGKMEIGLAVAFRNMGIPWSPLPEPGRPALVVGWPDWAGTEFVQNTASEVWLYTMSETDQVGPDWVRMINEYCAGVFVPARQLESVYRESGVQAPIHYAPLGLNHFGNFPPPVLGRKIPATRPFRFLTYSLGDNRKAAELAIMAFLAEFDGDPRYTLTIKCRDNYRATWLAGLQHDQITIVPDVIPESAWREMLETHDCFIFPSRGEGFGLPPREAVLAGMPTITTQWLGLEDSYYWANTIRMKGFVVAEMDRYEANAQGAKWLDPDSDHLKQLVRDVVHDYPAAVDQALAGRQYLMNTNDWREISRRILAIMRVI